VQFLTVEQLLPVPKSEKKTDTKALQVDYILEPSQEEIVEQLIPKNIKYRFIKLYSIHMHQNTVRV